jgi:hypothetical protein
VHLSECSSEAGDLVGCGHAATGCYESAGTAIDLLARRRTRTLVCAKRVKVAISTGDGGDGTGRRPLPYARVLAVSCVGQAPSRRAVS